MEPKITGWTGCSYSDTHHQSPGLHRWSRAKLRESKRPWDPESQSCMSRDKDYDFERNLEELQEG